MRLAMAISWRAHAANNVQWTNTLNVRPIYAILRIHSASVMTGSTQVAEKPRVAGCRAAGQQGVG